MLVPERGTAQVRSESHQWWDLGRLVNSVCKMRYIIHPYFRGQSKLTQSKT